MTGKHTFPKKEHLCSRKLIDHLFLDRSGAKKEWPVKVVYQLIDRKEETEPQVLMLVSVSKRHFKRAVKRNLVKRQVREAYRLHKDILADVMASFPDKQMVMAFIWMQDKIYASEDVSKAVVGVMTRMAKGIQDLVGQEEKSKDAAS